MPWNTAFELTDLQVAPHVNLRVRIPKVFRSDCSTLLLLHGFPQTHLMWRRVAERLQAHFNLVIPDLRGYGDSSKPQSPTDHSLSNPTHEAYSKRQMALDLVELMNQLGVPQFTVAGHDRGGRVAHRLALDHPAKVRKLCVLDIAPTLDMYQATDFAFAKAYYHWFHLIQPAPLPETMINGDPVPYLHTKLAGWGGTLSAYTPEALQDYERCICNPATVHAMCEDYRASATIDLEHDRTSRASGNKVQCDLHVLWGERGVVHRLFQPLALWQAQCAGQVSGRALPSGHFIPEELPDEVARELLGFFGAGT